MNSGIMAIVYFGAGVVAAFMAIFIFAPKEEEKPKKKLDFTVHDTVNVSSNKELNTRRDFDAHEAYDLALTLSSEEFARTHESVKGQYDKGMYRIRSNISVTITKVTEESKVANLQE